MKGLCVLLTIIKRADIKEYHKFFEKHSVSVVYDTLGNGTAHEKTLALLGIEKNEKAVLISLITYPLLKKLLRGLEKEMKIDLPDRGIAVAIPLASIGGARALEYYSAGQDTEFDDEGLNKPYSEEEKMQTVQELIVAVYEKGYTDMVMDAAREAGAGGGTTIRAKGTGAGAQRFFGLSLAEEKEMLFIVAPTEKRKEIMKAIMQKAGIDSKAHSLVFSLPVTESAGFRFSDEVVKE